MRKKRCRTHPTYKAKRMPSSQCEHCWYTWLTSRYSFSEEVKELKNKKNLETYMVSKELLTKITDLAYRGDEIEVRIYED